MQLYLLRGVRFIVFVFSFGKFSICCDRSNIVKIVFYVERKEGREGGREKGRKEGRKKERRKK